MLPGGDGWSLPCVVLDGKVWPSEADRINPAIRQVLGAPVTILRCADARRDSAAPDGFRAVIVLETHNPIREVPPGARWVTRERLADLRLAQAEHRPVIEECLAEAAGAPIPALRPSWERRGWFGQAVSWIQTQLTQLDLRPTGPVEQIRTWGISCVLRSPTTHGDVYFKIAAALPLFADEPLLITSLAGLHPRNIPAPLTIERDRRWMLLHDFGPKLRGSPDVSRWQEALRLFGEIQRAWAGRTDSLLAMGCVDRRLHRLALQIDPLFDDAGALASLDAPDLTQVRALAPRLAAMCAELADLGVPQTLVHGDLHAGNIAVRDGACLLPGGWPSRSVPFIRPSATSTSSRTWNRPREWNRIGRPSTCERS